MSLMDPTLDSLQWTVRVWSASAINRDQTDIYVCRYTKVGTTTFQDTATIEDGCIVWRPYESYCILQPFATISGLAMETQKHDLTDEELRVLHLIGVRFS